MPIDAEVVQAATIEADASVRPVIINTELRNGSVTTAKLADGAVTSAKLDPSLRMVALTNAEIDEITGGTNA